MPSAAIAVPTAAASLGPDGRRRVTARIERSCCGACHGTEEDVRDRRAAIRVGADRSGARVERDTIREVVRDEERHDQAGDADEQRKPETHGDHATLTGRP